MTENFYLDRSGVEQGTAILSSVGDRLTTAYNELTAVLDARHGCWGTDDIGKSFENGYVGSEAELREAGNPGDFITASAEGISKSAQDYDELDEENAAEIDRQFDPDALA